MAGFIGSVGGGIVVKVSSRMRLCLFVAALGFAAAAQSFIPIRRDFWTFVRGFDQILVVEIEKTELLRQGPKRCGFLNTATILKTVKGKATTPTFQFVTDGSPLVGGKDVLFLSHGDRAERKRVFASETGCAVGPHQWYFLGAASRVLGIDVALSSVFGVDVVVVPERFFENDARFIQDDVLVEGEPPPTYVRDFKYEGSGTLFAFLPTIEQAVRSGRKAGVAANVLTIDTASTSEITLALSMLRVAQNSLSWESSRPWDCPPTQHSTGASGKERDIFLKMTGKDLVTFRYTDGKSHLSMFL